MSTMSMRRSARLSTAAAPTTLTASENGNVSNTFGQGLGDTDIGAEDSEGKEDAETEGVVEDYGMSDEEIPPKRRKTRKGMTNSAHAPNNSAPLPSKTVASKAKPAARSRVQGRLKNIMSMPLDVLFEIFSALLPADLLSLARTSKNIRQVLMNRNHSGLWKAARANAPGLPSPDPPVDMSEPEWARLLYGGSGCYSCSAKNIQRIDFGLRRRSCVNCKKAFLVWKSRFKSVCDGMDAGLMDLVGYTNVSAHSHGHGSKNRYYWRPDLINMQRRLEELGKGEGGEAAVREFRTRKKAEVSEAMKGLPALETWATQAEIHRLQEKSSAQDENYQTAVARLKAAGYEDCDVPSYAIRSMLHGKPILNEAGWSRIFPKMEYSTIGNRNARVEREERNRLDLRSRTATWLYRDYLHTLVPVQWRYLPTPGHLLDTHCRDIPAFSRLVTLEQQPLQEEWNDAVAALPEELSTYLVSRLAPIAQAFPDLVEYPTSFQFALASDGSDPAVLDAITARFACLDLAKAVFRCNTQSWAAGYDAVQFQDKWLFRDDENITVALCSEGTSAVESIIQLIGDLPMSATATQLDEACEETRFRCATCSAKPGTLSVIYTGWRAYVTHCITMPPAPHQPEILPVHPSETPSSLKTQHGAHRRWACTHCHDYGVQFSTYSWYNLSESLVREEFVHGLGNACFALGSYDDLIEHNQSKHDIEDPRENYDFFYYAVPGSTRVGAY